MVTAACTRGLVFCPALVRQTRGVHAVEWHRIRISGMGGASRVSDHMQRSCSEAPHMYNTRMPLHRQFTALPGRGSLPGQQLLQCALTQPHIRA
jgi:hypothetical protein